MGSSNIRDLLTAFSPSLDYFAISSGDGRVKIWDTVKGQLQTEFSDIAPSKEDAGLYGSGKVERGHLSLDYTCMKWLSLDRKKKRKLGSSLLVLGTGSGDVLALDVSAGQLKWAASDCHPGGVNAVSFSEPDSVIYTAGTDGIVCKLDPQTGNVVGSFKASSKSISSMSVSPDGKIFATAAAQLRVFHCTNHKKIQKFSGHPGAVRYIAFSEDGKYILSCAVGERYVALWSMDDTREGSSSCVLAMEHPAVFLDCRRHEDSGICVLAISEIGVCYTWYGHSVEDLQRSSATKISLSSENSLKLHNKGVLPTIFAAKLQGPVKSTEAHVFVVYGVLVKPLFHKVVVQSGVDIKLHSSQEGVLLPPNQALVMSKRRADAQNRVTALDRTNVEDALLPIAKTSDFPDNQMRKDSLRVNSIEGVAAADKKTDSAYMDTEDMVEVETINMEKQLRQLNLLGSMDNGGLNSKLMLSDIDLEASIPPKKIRMTVSSMEPGNALKLLDTLVENWQLRRCKDRCVWVHYILVYHGNYILAQGKMGTHLLGSLLKISKTRGMAVQPLLQLSGRLQLVTAQIEKASLYKGDIEQQEDAHIDDDEGDEDDEDDVDEHIFGEESESELSSDED